MNHVPEIGLPPVKRRRVYYIGGFDPRGTAHYHRLYKEQAAKQGAQLGVHIEVGQRHKIATHLHSWMIKSSWHQHTVSTDYRFLSWDDIVRRHWQGNIAKLLLTAVKNYTGFFACGAMGQIRKLHRGPFYSGLYPIIFLLLLAALAVFVGVGLAAILTHIGSATTLAATLGLSTAGLLLWLGLKLAERLGVLWLLRTYLFVYAWGTSMPDILKQRIEAFSDLITQDQQDADCDEIILIGHSVGSILAVSVLARVLEKSSNKPISNMNFVTLGQCIPLLSLIPGAEAFRRDLKIVLEHPAVPWLDMVARADPLCFSQASPTQASSADTPAIKWPKTHIVRPFNMFSAAEYKRIKRNKLRLHFQYLMASDLQTDYDYFSMTAGPQRLSFSAG
jgi:hypothetical protein